MSATYLGIDVHKRFCVYVELDGSGKVVKRDRFGNNLAEISDFVSVLSGGAHVVVEPVLNYLWLLDEMEPYVASVHVAVPHRVRVIAQSKSKTDRYDARMLAELLRIDFLPEAYLPPRPIRSLREMLSQRRHLVRNRVMLKNRIRHLLFLHGCVIAVADVSSPKAQQELQRLYLPEVIRQGVCQCLDLIAPLNQAVAVVEKQIFALGEGNTVVSLLESIPGIGRLSALTIYAKVADIGRFPSRQQFVSYTGLAPTVRASGENIHIGSITRVGSKPLRTALVEASLVAARKSPMLKRLFYRVLYRSNVQKSRVAVARKLAVIIFAVWRRGEFFRNDLN